VTVYSIGYGNRTYDEFTQLLERFGFTHVVDVRAVPYSNYQVEFRRENLAELLPAKGFRYVFMGDTLGGATVRAASESKEAREVFELGLRKLLSAATNPTYKMALMCGCLLPHKCHRGKLLGQALLEQQVSYLHIVREGELLTHESLLNEIREVQGALF